MPRGGYRPGAGRPKGARNRRTLMLEEGNRRASEGGMEPLEYLPSVMRDEREPVGVRLDAARAAAPFCHPRLVAQHITHGSAGQSHEEWVKSMHRAIRESDEPELKLINASATEIKNAAMIPLDGQRNPNKE